MKAYVKPDLFCEDYELNMSVAACQLQMKNGMPKYDKDVVAYELLQAGGFSEGYCDTVVEDYGYYGGSGITYGS